MIVLKVIELIRAFWTDEEGQGLVEYALIIALISIVAALALYAFVPGGFQPLAEAITDKVNGAADSLNTAS